VLGDHVTQKGSLVDSEKLRFDFCHNEPLTTEQIRQVEHIVNSEIWRNSEVNVQLMSINDAKHRGAIALFDEKYGDEVRVLSMGADFSVELCGGTHASRTGDIGLFKIILVSSVASGVRRIEAYTHQKAKAFCDQMQDLVSETASLMHSSVSDLNVKALQMVEDNRTLRKQVDRLKQKLVSASGADLLSNLVEVQGVKVLATVVKDADAKSLKTVADQVRSRIEKGVFLLVAHEGERASLVSGVTSNLTDRLHAGDLMKFVTAQMDGKGGGRPDMAMGAANNLAELPRVLESVVSWVDDTIR
jgi:alanyl-tRNA synthetase